MPGRGARGDTVLLVTVVVQGGGGSGRGGVPSGGTI